MEHEPYHILWVSRTPSIPSAVQQVTRKAAAPVRITQAAPYDAAIQVVQCDMPDAVFLVADFDSLAVLEFVHHARLVHSQMPIMILCEEYDAALDYKSRKLGATECLTMAEVDGPFLGGLVKKGPLGPHGVRQSPRMGKGILQIPGLFK